MRDELNRIADALESIAKSLVRIAYPLHMLSPQELRRGPDDCGCPDNTFCCNAACPRGAKITASAVVLGGLRESEAGMMISAQTWRWIWDRRLFSEAWMAQPWRYWRCSGWERNPDFGRNGASD